MRAVAEVKAKQEKLMKEVPKINMAPLVPKEEEESDSETLKDVLALPGDLLDTDLVNTIMNADDDELTKNAGSLEGLAGNADSRGLGAGVIALVLDSQLPEDQDIDTLGSSSSTKDTKDEFTDILGTNFNIEAIPNINSKDVEDIFKVSFVFPHHFFSS